MYKSLAILLAAPMAIVAPAAEAKQVTNHPAQVQLQQNIDQVLQVARNSSLTQQQKINQIERYADVYLDYERISALAVGQPWRQFNRQQKTEFIAAFKEMMISMYARSALMGANDAKVTMLPKLVNNQQNRVEAFTQVTLKDGRKFEVGYQLYKVGSIYKIYNLRVDGASMVTIYRSQFNELIQQKGIDGTIAHIRTRGLKKAQ